MSGLAYVFYAPADPDERDRAPRIVQRVIAAAVACGGPEATDRALDALAAAGPATTAPELFWRLATELVRQGGDAAND